MSGMSITYVNKSQNLHSEPIHLKWSIQAMLPSNNSILMEYVSSSLKKTEAKKKETRPKPPLKELK